MTVKKRGEMLEQTEVRIPFEHLSPAAQGIIGGNNYSTIKKSRFMQRLTGLSAPPAFLFGLAVAGPLLERNLSILDIAGATIGAVVPSVYYNIKFAKKVQQAHEKLKRVINKHGVLHTPFEGRYPFNWISPTQVAKTHPIFYVTGKGDVVFKKNTRLEYMRYLDQKRWYGKKGLTPWRWRVYLEPPKAPEKVRTAVLAKLKLALAERSNAGLQPVPVPVTRRKRT